MDTFFENSSHFTVQDSQLYNAKEITIINNHDTGNLTEVSPGNWYRTIAAGDLNLLRDWGSVAEVEEVDRAGTRSYMIRCPTGVSRIIGVKLVRSVYTVQITSPSLSHPGTKFTAVFYGGPNAQQTYKEDLLQYSSLCHINIAKLFHQETVK
ncbi:hypothetical protein BDP27DRAFT_526106 [Rhodocollybia butyracea]|uniref:Uncharacterized protein n=1 Tax=Rhodocollybia butyracea TaxID=206335 RepID=A0A9P5PWQ7_9AGAR|nr:hypothetical protein BDP27DRAFT_526106 [Rhodocollybia butyracea]